MGSLVLFDVVINAFSSGNQGFICSFSYMYGQPIMNHFVLYAQPSTSTPTWVAN